jgi:acyl-CoA reductase-like NAD-dependent aldehyde dehydrogenase
LDGRDIFTRFRLAHYAAQSAWIFKPSPVNGASVPFFFEASESEIENKIDNASSFFFSGEWRFADIKQRKAALYRWANLIDENKKDLALIDCVGTGRPYSQLLHDSVPKAIRAIRWFAEAADKFPVGGLSQRRLGAYVFETREPYGVIASVLPWNDPLVVFAWKVVPALLTGNSVVVKPSEYATISILKCVELAYEAGVPAHALVVLPGTGGRVGKKIVQNQKIKGVLFTGSTKTGIDVVRASNEYGLKPTSLECGGKSPFIISKHCNDVIAATDIFVKMAFYNCGQICSAPTRLLVHRDVRDKVTSRLLQSLANFQPGNPLDPQTKYGAMINVEAVLRVKRLMKSAADRGLTLLSSTSIDDHTVGGTYCSPVVVLDVSVQDEIWQEEIFGPVAVLSEFSSIEEAISMANSSRFGLSAGLFSQCSREIGYFVSQIRAGMIHINSYGDDDESVPFGGIGDSGYGKDKGVKCFEEVTYLKAGTLSLVSSS